MLRTLIAFTRPKPFRLQELKAEGDGLPKPWTLLGGSGVVISGVISPLIWVISIVTLLITLLIP